MNILHLKGKTALITGSAKRIGRAIALELGSHGVHILAHYYQSREEIAQVLKELENYDIKTSAVQADFSSDTQVTELFQDAANRTGSIDILINNASIFPESRLLDFSFSDLCANVQINSYAPLQLCRSFYKQGISGSIINFLDTLILDYDSRHVAYHLSKRMLFALTRMMAMEFAPGIRVNAIAPGVILPPTGNDHSNYQAMIQGNPLKTHGTLEDITDSVLFLLCNSFITGQVLYIDGGRHMRGEMYGS